MNYKPFDGSFSIKDKVALVTGAASGIGKATAIAFAKAGAKLVLIDMSPAVEGFAKELTDEFGAETLPVVCDLTPVSAGPMIVEKADERFGRIDILASIAGVGLVDYAVDITEELWDKTMLINSKAAFFLCQAVGKYMIVRRRLLVPLRRSLLSGVSIISTRTWYLLLLSLLRWESASGKVRRALR